MSDDNDYQPIACGLYSEYELAIMHRHWWRLAWCDEGGQHHVALVRPQDLRTERDQGEFLLAEDANGQALKIRLDRILSHERVPPPGR